MPNYAPYVDARKKTTGNYARIQAISQECVGLPKIFFLFLNQNICCGYLKEPVLLSTQNKFQTDGLENTYNFMLFFGLSKSMKNISLFFLS